MERTCSTTLYYDELCPQARSCLMLIKALNIKVELLHVDLMLSEHLTIDYDKLNPAHTVPTLKHGKLVLTNSQSILMFLCDKFSGELANQLFPHDFSTRLNIVNCLFFESSILSRRQSEFMNELMRKTAAGTDLSYHRQRIHEAYAMLESLLAKNQFMAGKRLTIADICMVSTISSMDLAFPIREYRQQWPNLFAWFQSMRNQRTYHLNYFGIRKQRSIMSKIGKFLFPSRSMLQTPNPYQKLGSTIFDSSNTLPTPKSTRSTKFQLFANIKRNHVAAQSHITRLMAGYSSANNCRQQVPCTSHTMTKSIDVSNRPSMAATNHTAFLSKADLEPKQTQTCAKVSTATQYQPQQQPQPQSGNLRQCMHANVGRLSKTSKLPKIYASKQQQTTAAANSNQTQVERKAASTHQMRRIQCNSGTQTQHTRLVYEHSSSTQTERRESQLPRQTTAAAASYGDKGALSKAIVGAGYQSFRKFCYRKPKTKLAAIEELKAKQQRLKRLTDLSKQATNAATSYYANAFIAPRIENNLNKPNSCSDTTQQNQLNIGLALSTVDNGKSSTGNDKPDASDAISCNLHAKNRTAGGLDKQSESKIEPQTSTNHAVDNANCNKNTPHLDLVKALYLPGSDVSTMDIDDILVIKQTQNTVDSQPNTVPMNQQQQTTNATATASASFIDSMGTFIITDVGQQMCGIMTKTKTMLLDNGNGICSCWEQTAAYQQQPVQRTCQQHALYGSRIYRHHYPQHAGEMLLY